MVVSGVDGESYDTIAFVVKVLGCGAAIYAATKS
jgi:hypothetical protein